VRDLGFASDLRACLALRDERAKENAAARDRAVANAKLVSILQEDAARRGLDRIQWDEYFRNIGINYP
jgi:predicted solute-binding protein